MPRTPCRRDSGPRCCRRCARSSPTPGLSGEMIHGDYIDYVKTSGLDSVTEYELWWAIWSSIDTVNFHELQWTLGRHAKFVDHFLPLTFLGNHDVTRVASQISDSRHWSHAVALLGFLPGVPSVYYGDEFGLEAVKEDRPSGDDAVRPQMPKERWLFTHSHPEVEQAYRRVIGLRRRNPWLVDAIIDTEQVENARIVIRSRARHGEESLVLALNLTGEPLELADSEEVLEAEPASQTGPWLHTAGRSSRAETIRVQLRRGVDRQPVAEMRRPFAPSPTALTDGRARDRAGATPGAPR